MKHEFLIQGVAVEVSLRRQGSGWVATFADGHELHVSHWSAGHLLFEDGTSLEYARGPDQISVLGELLSVRIADESAQEGAEGPGDGRVSAPMNGQVIKLLKTPGQPLLKGEVVLVLEAMKMENEVISPLDGMLEGIQVIVGQTVAPGDLLFVVTQNGEVPCP